MRYRDINQKIAQSNKIVSRETLFRKHIIGGLEFAIPNFKNILLPDDASNDEKARTILNEINTKRIELLSEVTSYKDEIETLVDKQALLYKNHRKALIKFRGALIAAEQTVPQLQGSLEAPISTIYFELSSWLSSLRFSKWRILNMANGDPVATNQKPRQLVKNNHLLARKNL